MATSESDNVQKVIDPPVILSQCTNKAPALSPDDYGTMVTVIVGAEQERKFYVHKGLLEHYSSYFRRALKEVWEEGVTQEVKLTEDDPEVFRVFFHWLMTGKLYGELNEDKSIPIEYQLIWKLYAFGDARGIPEFCNATINIFYQKFCQVWSFPMKDLNYIYENTLPKSTLRKAVVKFLTDNYNFKELTDVTDEALEKYPKEFMAEVIIALLALVDQPLPPFRGSNKLRIASKIGWIDQTKGNVCSLWHEHAKAKEQEDSSK